MEIEGKADSKSDRFAASAIAHIDSIYRFALYMTGDERDAEDLVQDTYLKAYRFFDKFREGTDCKAWLIVILKNTFINKYRRDKRRGQEVSLSKLEEYEPGLLEHQDPEDEIFGDLLGDEVSEAMDALPYLYRKAVELADLKGFSYREISHMLGCPIGTVMSRLHRGRMLLRMKLENYASQLGYGRGRADAVAG